MAAKRDPSVIGPLGERLTRAMLPPPGTRRWTSRRKAQLVVAVQGGLITVDEVCEAYEMSIDELASLCIAFESHGMHGLRATGLQREDNPFKLLNDENFVMITN